jgi:hypothetical protein
MTIFDVLRYTISDPPTETEFAALPAKLIEQWLPNTGWSTYGSSDTTSYYLAEYYSSSMKGHHELDLLRRMIREYDEPI